MRADWAAPVSAVLDHFDVDEATLIGVSLGGGLVTHAAAKEPHTKRVVAFDVLDNFLEALVSQALPPTLARRTSRALSGVGPLITRTPTSILNRMLAEQARNSLVTWWGCGRVCTLRGRTRPPSSCVPRPRSPQPMSPHESQAMSCSCRAQRTSLCHRTEWFVRSSASPPPVRSSPAPSPEPSNAANHCQIGNTEVMARTILA